MTTRTCISILVAFGVAGLARSIESATAANDLVVVRAQELFAQADALVAQRPQRSRQYLSSLSDEQLATVYAQTIISTWFAEPRKISTSSTSWIEAVAQDRQGVITELVTQYYPPLSEQQDKDLVAEYEKISDELAALGPGAVPTILAWKNKAAPMTGYPGRAGSVPVQAMGKMGANATVPLIALMDSNDVSLRERAAGFLDMCADARAKDVLLRATTDESGRVRNSALRGLVRLSPGVIGSEKLTQLLVDHLEDEACLPVCIGALGRYGDETALEPLRVIEQFAPGAGESGLRSSASLAIEIVLKRAGKWEEEAKREPAPGKTVRQLPYEEIIGAASCPNAVLRAKAIRQLESYHDDRTVQFLKERLQQEKNATVLKRVTQALSVVTVQPRAASNPPASPAQIQESFDKCIRGLVASAPADANQKVVAIQGARSALFKARDLSMRLDHVDQFKEVVRRNLPSDSKDVRAVCYLACTEIATLPEDGQRWTPKEKEELTQQLLPALNSPDPDFSLIECLGLTEDKRLTSRLVELLGHSNPDKRISAARALGYIGDGAALQPLRKLRETDPYRSENGDYFVRNEARGAIGLIAWKEAK